MEEIVSRGMVQSLLRPLESRRLRLVGIELSVPVLTAAAFFSAMPLPLLLLGIDTTTGFQIFTSTFFLGLIAGFFRETTGSLVPTVLAHVWANVCGIGIETVLQFFE